MRHKESAGPISIAAFVGLCWPMLWLLLPYFKWGFANMRTWLQRGTAAHDLVLGAGALICLLTLALHDRDNYPQLALGFSVIGLVLNAVLILLVAIS